MPMLESGIQGTFSRTNDLDIFAAATLSVAAPKANPEYDRLFPACANAGPFSEAVFVLVSEFDDF
jgi:hypothetical protein